MNNIPLILRWLLGIGYVVLGVFVLTGQFFEPALFNHAFGIIAIAYGIFRGVRAWKDYQLVKEEPEEL